MHSTTMRRTVGATALLAAATALTLPAGLVAQQQQSARPALTAELAAVKTSLDKYQDPIAAVYDGYFSTLGCVDYPEGGHEGEMQYKPGGMGVHFFNPAFIGPTLSPDKPQVLIYEPHGESFRLVAAEWFVPMQLVKERPTIFGKPLDGPMAGHEPLMPEGLAHYDLHVWLWKDNPLGVFSPTNPNVKCPKSALTFKEKAPKLLKHEH